MDKNKSELEGKLRRRDERAKQLAAPGAIVAGASSQSLSLAVVPGSLYSFAAVTRQSKFTRLKGAAENGDHGMVHSGTWVISPSSSLRNDYNRRGSSRPATAVPALAPLRLLDERKAILRLLDHVANPVEAILDGVDAPNHIYRTALASSQETRQEANEPRCS